MKLKLRHLRHPLRTANAARGVVAAELAGKRFAEQGRRQFANDPRYDLRCVTEGFADRSDAGSDDAVLLERICAAYIRASRQEQAAPEAYRATGWWEQQRQGSLGAVIRALQMRDIPALQEMYGNFYRDACSAGLIVLQRAAKDYFGGTMKEKHRRFCMADALYRMDYWKAQTNGRFASSALEGPRIGNPFGVMVDGTLVRPGADYQHYCAVRVGELLGSDAATAVEIGGGFGGMAYYLLRDRVRTTYINFDVPESVALMSYYLMKAFPERKFLLYGEEELAREAIDRADVVLMPVSELGRMPAGSADVTFSSHAMSDLAYGAMSVYLSNVARMTRGWFLFIGSEAGGEAVRKAAIRQPSSFDLVEKKVSGWHSHRAPESGEMEQLFRMSERDLRMLWESWEGGADVDL